MFTGDGSPLGTHPLIDGAGDFHRQVDLLDPHIHHLDAELGGARHLHQGIFHHGTALTGDDVLDGAVTDLGTQTVVDLALEQVFGLDLVATTGRQVVLGEVLDLPLHVGVDDEVFLLGGDEAIRLAFQGLDTGIHLANLIDERHLEVQARLIEPRLAGVNPLHLAKLHHDSLLPFIDDEDGREADHGGHSDDTNS
ncbi:hypothetical protein D3C84_454430 [compost metagenome]